MGDKNTQEILPTPSQRAQEAEAQKKAGGISDAEVQQARDLFRLVLTSDEGPIAYITKDTYWNQLLNKQKFGQLVGNPRVRVYVAHLMMAFTKSERNKQVLDAFITEIDQSTGTGWRVPSSVPPPLEVSV